MSVSTELGVQRELTLPQGTISYRERGEGRPVVFVHGFMANGDLWRKVAPALPEGHRTFAVDWPLGSHELSMPADADLTPPGLARLIADFIAALDLEDVVLVGCDNGGALCQLVATRHPERIGALVLTPCDAFENFPPAMFRPLAQFSRVPGAMWLTAQSLRLDRIERAPMAYGWAIKRPVPPEISESYIGPARRDAGVRRDAGKAVRGMRPEHTLVAASRLPGFGRPALVVWASEDRFFPVEHGRRLAELLDAPFELVDDSYAFMPEDRPERLTELLSEFLTESAAVPAAARS
jgi:pimeloyl-ACP methyl ester carboxylesterase